MDKRTECKDDADAVRVLLLVALLNLGRREYLTNSVGELSAIYTN